MRPCGYDRDGSYPTRPPLRLSPPFEKGPRPSQHPKASRGLDRSIASFRANWPAELAIGLQAIETPAECGISPVCTLHPAMNCETGTQGDTTQVLPSNTVQGGGLARKCPCQPPPATRHSHEL